MQAAKVERDDEGAERLLGLDRGVKVTAATSNGGLLTMPPVWVAARDEIAELQRQRATKKKYSRAWRALNRRIARLYAKA